MFANLLKREESSSSTTANAAHVANKTAEPAARRPARTPAVSVQHTDAGLLIWAELPGVDADHVQISVDHGVLTMRGRTEAHAPDGYEALHREFASADFERSFTLPNDVDPDQINASVKHGVLRLELPKVKEAQPRRIAVKAG